MKSVVTVSSKYQIVIPKELRELLGISPGDQLLMEAVDSGQIRLRPRPNSYAKALRGLHKEIWRDVDATEYVAGERDSWENR